MVPAGLIACSHIRWHSALDAQQGWTGLVNLPGIPHEVIQHWWMLPGSARSKVIQHAKSKLPGGPWRSLWPCWEMEAIPVDCTREDSPGAQPPTVMRPAG